MRFRKIRTKILVRINFYKELADLLNKYRPIKNQIDYRREDEDWIQLRVPYSFLVGDKDYCYEQYLYKCSKCGVQDFTNDLMDNKTCDMCYEGTMQRVELKHYNDWIKHPK